MIEDRKEYFPLFVSSENKGVLVVGGGNIATRRVKSLLEFCFDITVTAPIVTKELKGILKTSSIIFYEREFIIEDLENKYMVIAATNNRDVNTRIGKICREKNIFVSVADQKDECNFYFPAVVFDDEVVIGLTSEGRSHKAVAERAKKLREEIADANKNR